MLARKAITINSRIYGVKNRQMNVCSLGVLSLILELKENNDNELKDLFESLLAIDIENNGIQSREAAEKNFELSVFYFNVAIKLASCTAKTEQLYIAESYCKEAIRISRQKSTHEKIIRNESFLSKITKSFNL